MLGRYDSRGFRFRFHPESGLLVWDMVAKIGHTGRINKFLYSYEQFS